MSYDAIIDANIHRFKEGARVLEDLARFVLKDEALFGQLKSLKHRVRCTNPYYASQTDVGAQLVENNQRENIIALALANGYRMQEAARVLEEVEGEHYKDIRFCSYALHAQLIAQLKKNLKHADLRGIYALCDPLKISPARIAAVIHQRGISVCQVRMKSATKRQIIEAVQRLRALLNSKTLLIVNDHLDVALGYADGVHLGQSDFPLKKARQMAPYDFIIGSSCHNVQEAQSAIAQGASYICVGCIYPSQTKQDVTPTSLQTLSDIIKIATVPVGAIGGIQESDFEMLSAMGVDLMVLQQGLWPD